MNQTIFSTLFQGVNEYLSNPINGPAVSVIGNIPVFDVTTGNSIADSGKSFTTDGTLSANSDLLIPTEKAVKTYVDLIAAGLEFEGLCYCATTANLTATYVNGVAGVGATLTNAGSLAAFSVDGQNPTVGKRVLVKNQSTTAQNGIYTVTTVGSGAVAWVLTRATDYDTPGEITAGGLVPVQNGAENANSVWLETSTVTTIGTDPITFQSFYNPSNVAITGGTINGATIGTTAAASGRFTTLAAITLAAGALTNCPILYTDTSGNITADSLDLTWDDTNKRLGINQQGLTPTGTLDVHSNTFTVPVAQFNQTGAQSATGGAIIQVQADSGAALGSGNRLGALQFTAAYNALSNTNIGATIHAIATQLWTASANGTKLEFYTTANNAISRSLALTLGQDLTATFAGAINGFTLTASQLLATDASKNLQSLTTATYPSLTEISYVKGVTSAIQTQLNAKAALISPAFTTPDIGAATGTSLALTGGAFTEAGLYTLASDASGTTDIGAAPSNNILLTGSNTITSFGTAPTGTVRTIRVGGSGGSVITYNQVSLITSNAKNITTVGNDIFEMYSLGSGNWIMRWYKTNNGRSISNSFSNLTDAATVAINFALANNFNLTLGGNRTLGIPSNPESNLGVEGSIVVRQDSTGGRTLSYSWPYIFPQSLPPILSTGKGAMDLLTYKVLSYSTKTATMTIATPCVVTATSHGFVYGQRVAFTTTGALPTGITADTGYYINVIDANTFNLATSQANLQAGTYVATSGSQSGTHTVTQLTILVSINQNNGA